MSQPTAATATAGIYCKTCGYDLRASGEAGRCPECGRGFAPGDPKTFRKRPFAAPWKRALARWMKRGAMLLLVLAVLLGGLWGWLYWGWKQEQAVLAQARTNARNAAAVYVILGGARGEWLYYRDFPGSFVLARVRAIHMPKTATDADLLPLRKLARLETLGVEGAITDAGLASLRQGPQLRQLWIRCPGITDAGLAALRDLPRLEVLKLFDVPITDAGLAPLAALTQLEKLSLENALLTDAGLAHLAPLRKLHVLNLQGTRITDAGLVHLEKHPALRELYLVGTAVTPAGIARLQAALPGCAIQGPYRPRGPGRLPAAAGTQSAVPGLEPAARGGADPATAPWVR